MTHPNIIASGSIEILNIAKHARTVAVLGIKTASKASQPAYFVPEYLQSTGMKIIPVPVYFPEAKSILGEPVIRDLKMIKDKVDILDIFRPSAVLKHHLEEILLMNPRPTCIWLQSGIRDEEFEEELAKEGFKVVVDHCLKVERQKSLDITSKF